MLLLLLGLGLGLLLLLLLLSGVALSLSHTDTHGLYFSDIIKRVKDEETVFLVTQYHQFCDLTAQSAHQAFCNFLSLLEVHKKRHKWIKTGWRYTCMDDHTYTHTHPHPHPPTHRQTDNCYTYQCKKICLAMTQVHEIVGIHIAGDNNNEPNHGGDKADQSGNNMKCGLSGWTRKWHKEIQHA